MERKRFRGSVVGVGLAFALLLLTSVAWGQVSGTMSGYVTDNTGALVPGATLTATIEGRGTTFSATSNTEGFYTFTALEPGTYTLSVEKKGFKRYFQKDLSLTVRQNLRVDVSLVLGSVNQSVTVTSTAPLVDTTSATVSGLVNDQRIVDLHVPRCELPAVPPAGLWVFHIGQLAAAVCGSMECEHSAASYRRHHAGSNLCWESGH